MNQVKIAGHGASVENFNTTRIFFAPKNRNTVVNKIFKNLTSAEKARVLENDLLGINCMIY